MERRTFLATLAGSLLAAPLAAEAQPAGKIPRIGFGHDPLAHSCRVLPRGLPRRTQARAGAAS